MVERSRSHELFSGDFLLTRELMDWFAVQYVADADPTDPRLSVLRTEDLGGARPAYVATAGFDPLRDEGEAYAEALRAAGGAPVVSRRFPGLVHGFCNAIGPGRVSHEALTEVAGATCAPSHGLPTGHLPRALNRPCPRARVKRRCARPRVGSLGSS
jgi:acetyl esterase